MDPPAGKPDDPLRVLLWSQQGSSESSYSGPGKSALRLYPRLRALADRPLRVTLAHNCDDHPAEPAYEEQHLVVGPGPIRQVRLARQGARWVRDQAGRFDVFHGVDGFGSTVAAAVAAERAGVPACLKLATHRIDLADKSFWRHRLLGLARRRRRLIGDHVSAVICISRAIVEEVRGYGIPDDKIVYLPDGVDVARFEPPADAGAKGRARDEAGVPRDARLVVAFCGSVIRRKQPHLLAAAVARVPGVHALLIGPTPDAAYAEEVRRAAGAAADRLHWTGFRDDPAPFYRASDLFCLPSTAEGLANSILEAIATGLVPLLTDISGSRDVVTPGTLGEIVAPEAEDIARALSAYAGDADRLAAEAGAARRLAVEVFSHERTAREHLKLFDRVIRGQPASTGDGVGG